MDGDLRQCLFDLLHGRIAACIAAGAYVQRAVHTPGHHGGGAGRHLQLADRGDQVAAACAGDTFDGQQRFGCGAQCVAAQRHAGGAGVPGAALEAQREASLRGDGADDAERQSFRFQYRALFDMRFQIRQHAARRAGRVLHVGDVQVPLGQGTGHRDAGGIGDRQRGGVERAGHRAAAEHGRGKTRAFFVAEGDDLDGERQPAPMRMQRRDAFDAEQDAERAVVAPGIAHAVQVAADQ